ncbi:MAG: hypothetical protein ACK4PK_03110 [Alphaproteobacteria bacterium]
MNFKIGIFLAVFMLVCLSPAVTSAMEERPKAQTTSSMCDMSGKVQKFTLTSGSGEVKETFKVPVRYMSMELERNGRVNTSLHLDAVFGSLEPRCQDSGWPLAKEEALQVVLSINRRPPEEWADTVKMTYMDTDQYQFEEIDIEGYPDFSFKASNRRPAPKAPTSATYGYIPVYPKKEINIPTYFLTECRLAMDMKTFDLCKISFLYKERIAVRTQFPPKELENLEQVYFSSIELIKKFHVK